MKQNVKNKLTKIKKQNELINTENTLYLKTRKEQKGITLIALVITIIVLLILAGVAIATLLGDNGIITRATTAKEKTQQVGVLERVQIEVQGSYGTDGAIDIEQLNENLKNNITGLTYNGNKLSDTNKIDKLPVTVVIDKYKIKIDEDGTVILIDGITAEDLTEDIYGAYVNYGIDINGDGDTTKDWRIFYIEDYEGEGEDAKTNPKKGKRIFIISSDYVGNTCEALTGNGGAMNKSKMLQGTGTYESTGLYKDCCYYWQKDSAPDYKCMLPNEGKNACAFPYLFEFTKYSIKENKNNNNSKCVASLLCTENWSKFITTGGEYAIGGPTLEMWVNSWNEKESGANNFSKLFAVPSTDNTPKGYYVGMDANTTDTAPNLSNVGTENDGTGYYDTLYFPHRENNVGDLDKDNKDEIEAGYWIASPSADSFSNLKRVRYNGDVSYNNYDFECNGLRPVVCLNSNIQLKQEIDGDGKVYYNIR